ncbi:MAG: thioredoxin-like domain-containing protein [Verrucomicrobiota bacterium]
MHLLIKYLSIGLLAAALPMISIAVEIGQTEIEVRRQYGKASSSISVGAKKVLVYPAGRVILINGKVSEIEGDLDAKAPEVEAPKKSESKKAVSKKAPSKFISKFQNDLVDAKGASVQVPDLADKNYILVYYSASWCPPCRKFTPKLVSFYKKYQKKGNFELIFMSSDRSAKDSKSYMQDYKMPWPAVRYDRMSSSGLQGKGGRGIPSLVLFDTKGKIVSSSYNGRNYLGPNKVLDDLKKKF